MRTRLFVALAAVALIAVGVALGLLIGERTTAVAAQPGPVDIGFSQDMSTHHAQAIQMAGIVASNPDPAVTAMATRIRTAQLEEIGRMQGFLTVWDQPTIATAAPMSWMDHEPMDHPTRGAEMSMTDTAMPGLATQDQLTRLRSLTGSDQAILFLQLMLRHHQGGIQMSDYTAQHAALPAVQALAARMSFDQQQENQILAQLLAAHDIDPGDAPR